MNHENSLPREPFFFTLRILFLSFSPWTAARPRSQSSTLARPSISSDALGFSRIASNVIAEIATRSSPSFVRVSTVEYVCHRLTSMNQAYRIDMDVASQETCSENVRQRNRFEGDIPG